MFTNCAQANESLPAQPGVLRLAFEKRGEVMATLNDLVEALANLTRIPKATIFAYGRFAREQGLIAQKGHGRAAAKMGLQDAANLLIAISGTPVTREAADAVRKFRPMTGLLDHFGSPETFDRFFVWIAPIASMTPGKGHGWEAGTFRDLEVDFGAFLEFLIAEAVNGGLMTFLQSIPYADIDENLWREWIETNNDNLHLSIDLLLRRKLLSPFPAGTKIINQHVQLAITFFQTNPRIDVEFLRDWVDGPQTILQFQLFPKGYRNRPLPLSASTTLTQDVLFGLGLVLAGDVSPKALGDRRRLTGIYERQAESVSGRDPNAVSALQERFRNLPAHRQHALVAELSAVHVGVPEGVPFRVWRMVAPLWWDWIRELTTPDRFRLAEELTSRSWSQTLSVLHWLMSPEGATGQAPDGPCHSIGGTSS
jgi:hypothetical protein